MNFPQKKRDRQLSRFFILIVVLILTACQANQATLPPTSAPTETPAPSATLIPTPTPAGPPGVLWVDLTKDLGEINKYILGANHGPWSDLGAANIKPAQNSGITFLRWPGGSWGDHNDIRTNYIDNYILVARNIMKAEPSITVRLLGGTPAQAAQLVKYVNIDMGYNVKYWSIGNEPDLFIQESSTWTPEYYANTWREFAIAMKAVDPNIILYGPDISDFVGDEGRYDKRELLYVKQVKMEFTKRDYLIEFLKLNADLVDIVTIHRYPFPQGTTDSIPTWDQLRANTAEWDRILPNLHRLIKETTGSDKPVGITEFNSSATNSNGAETSPDSFYNALWLADVMGRSIKQQPEMLAYWMLKSSSSAGSVAGHGLMDSFNVRPSYYAYQIYARFGNHLLQANSDTEYVSVYAAKRDDGSVTVILINLNGTEIKKPLQLEQGDQLTLAEAYLFDATHKAEASALPAFTNGGEITLPKESVTLFVFKP